MQITQHCPRSAFGDMTAAWQRWWQSRLRCRCMHIPPRVSSVQTPPPGLPVLRLAPAATAATPRARHPTTTPAAAGPHHPCKPLPRRSQTWSWPGALSHPRPKTTAPALPGQREAEQEREAPGSPAEGLLHRFDIHTAVHAPSKHSGSGHQALVSPPCNVRRFPT